MNTTALRSYLKFLSRHKVYTFVSVVGFAISLTFVIILSVYAGTQVSMDSFHENGDRLFLLVDEESSANSNPVGDYVKDLLPEVETYSRVLSTRENIGLNERDWTSGTVMYADRDFFRMFSFPLLEGNAWEVVAAEKSAVVSLTTANRLFGDVYPVGKTVVVGGNELTVTGVMEDFPYNTHFLPHDVVIPYGLTTTYFGRNVLESWGHCNFSIYFLGRENTDLRSKEWMLLEKFKEDYWPYEDGYSEVVQFLPVGDIYFSGLDVNRVESKTGSLDGTRIFFGVAITILIIALLNYVNMTVAQTGFRGREAAVKKLMGSSRAKLVVQLLSESFIMTFIASALAVLCAFAAEPSFERLFDTRLDLTAALVHWRSAGIMIGSMVFIAVVAGIMPALAVSAFRPIEVVQGTFTRRVKGGYSKMLIVFQFAVCTTLMICAFLMGRQVRYMGEKDLGFNRKNILSLENSSYLSGEALLAAKERLMGVPGVEDVGFAYGSPFDGGNNNSFEINGKPITMNIISGDSAYVKMLGLKFSQDFTVSTGDASTPVYLNRVAMNIVQRENIDKPLAEWDENAYVAGLMDDFHMSSLHKPIGPIMFYHQQNNGYPWDLYVKVSSPDLYETAGKVRAVYEEITEGKHFNWYFSDERIEQWYDSERRMTAVMGAFTLLSIVIMVMGVFAMSLYMIRQKEKEIGIRKVSGATVREVLGMLNRQSLRRVAIAFVIACPVAYYACGRWLETFAYRIDIIPLPFILAGVLVAVLCLASVSWQTWHAARANPVKSLKSE